MVKLYLVLLIVLMGCNNESLINKQKDYFSNKWKDKSWSKGPAYMKIYKKDKDEKPNGLCLGWSISGNLIEIIYYKDGLPYNGCKYLPMNNSKDVKIIQDQNTTYFVELYENGVRIKAVELKDEISEYIDKLIKPNYQAELDYLKKAFVIQNIIDLNK